MKAIVLAAGIAVVASGSLAQQFMVGEMPDGYLNLRAGPRTNHKILTRLFPDDDVTYVEERGNWLKVRLRNGEVGWASETFLHVYTNYDGTVLTVQQTPTGHLNLREGPSGKNPVKGRLFPGDTVINYARKGPWIRVQNRRGDFGWVHSKYLAF